MSVDVGVYVVRWWFQGRVQEVRPSIVWVNRTRQPYDRAMPQHRADAHIQGVCGICSNSIEEEEFFFLNFEIVIKILT